MRNRKVVFGIGMIIFLFVVGKNLAVSATSSVPYSIMVTPTAFMTPTLSWTITNVTDEAVSFWTGSLYWQASAGEKVVFTIQELRGNAIYGTLVLGNMTLFTNDSNIASDLALGIWPWAPGLVSHLDWEHVDQNATNAATSTFMNGSLIIRTTVNTKTYNYHQGPFGNQNTTLVYDLNTGILQMAYTEFFFLHDYHLGLELKQAKLVLTNPTLLVGGGAIALAVFAPIIFIHRRK